MHRTKKNLLEHTHRFLHVILNIFQSYKSYDHFKKMMKNIFVYDRNWSAK